MSRYVLNRFCLCLFDTDEVFGAAQASDSSKLTNVRKNLGIRDMVIITNCASALTLVVLIGLDFSELTSLAETLKVKVITIAVPELAVLTLSLIARDFIEYA